MALAEIIQSSSGYVLLAINFVKSNILYLLLGAFVIRVIYFRYLHRLSKVPGPFWASITDFYEIYYFLSGKGHLKEVELHKKYGPIFRLRPNMVVVSDPKYLPIIYHKDVDKTPFHKSGGFGFGLSTIGQIHHKDHARCKKRVASSYSMTSIRGMESYVDERVYEWVYKLDELFVPKKKLAENELYPTFDMGVWSQYLAYDVLSDTVFGAPLGFCRTASDVGGLIQGLHDGLAMGGILARLPWLNKILLLPGMKHFLPKSGDKHGVGSVMTFRDKLLKERIENGNKHNRKDFLTNFLAAKNDDGTPITLEEVKAELLVAMLAGSDTTASSIRQFFIRVLEEPGEIEKVVAEIDAAYDDRTKPLKHSKGIINFDDTNRFLYTCASIREAMRVNAPVTSWMTRMVSEPGYEILGYKIPAGSQAACNAWMTNINKEMYGEDAENYRPERWLEDKVKLEKYENNFGYGSRTCLGKNLALVEMHKAIIAFLRLFKPTLLDKPPPHSTIFRSHVNLGVWIEKGIWMQIERRDVPEWSYYS